jgi:hypothetical protein
MSPWSTAAKISLGPWHFYYNDTKENNFVNVRKLGMVETGHSLKP